VQLDKAAIGMFPVIKEKLARFPRLRFILFLDDLSFDEEDASYAALKAALEGSLATADNARIYVTTNRRHLVKESHSSRTGDDVHMADAREEARSLFDRFGLVITYVAPDKREYVSILQQILRDRGVIVPDEQAALIAERYAIKKGGRSPRAAKQLADMIESGTAL
ncbi:MAG: ATP-binding protein, partial [Clostridiales bacterium]|nr:ATP-binding protein [Clostridiales bacterium]